MPGNSVLRMGYLTVNSTNTSVTIPPAVNSPNTTVATPPPVTPPVVPPVDATPTRSGSTINRVSSAPVNIIAALPNTGTFPILNASLVRPQSSTIAVAMVRPLPRTGLFPKINLLNMIMLSSSLLYPAGIYICAKRKRYNYCNAIS